MMYYILNMSPLYEDGPTYMTIGRKKSLFACIKTWLAFKILMSDFKISSTTNTRYIFYQRFIFLSAWLLENHLEYKKENKMGRSHLNQREKIIKINFS